MRFNRAAALVLTLMLSAIARAQSDSLLFNLDETVLTSERRSGAIARAKASSMKLELDRLASAPRTFGSNDPLRMAESLPGISTNSEIESGIHIQGCEAAHNIIMIGDAPVYGSSHMLGLFSTFIPSHFSSMELSTSAHMRNRIGGQLTMDTADTVARRTSISIDSGLFFSQGTAGFRTSANSSLLLSARGSYINALYSRYLNLEGNQMRYGFGDVNASWTAKPSGNDLIKVDLYYGKDDVSIDAASYDVPLAFSWTNSAVSARWKHGSTNRSLYYSSYSLGCETGSSLNLPRLSDMISTAGYRTEHSLRFDDESALQLGGEFMIHDSNPLTREDRPDRRMASEVLAFQSYEKSFGDVVLGAELTESGFFRNDQQPYWGISPVLKASYDLHRYGTIEARGGQMVQYLFQTGVSDSGFPTEYWILAGDGLKPQKSRFVSLSYATGLANGRYSLSIESYYKHLENQLLYRGSLMDYFDADYSLDGHLSQTRGRNYGVTMLVSRNSGKLTGWVAYSIGRALRGENTPSSHERIHELNAVLSYKADRWDCGATFVAASGTPFTAAKSFYLVSEMVIANYGDYNGSRLPAYSRLDLSANWYFIRSHNREMGINVSLYNALGYTNVVSYRTQINDNSNKFEYKPVAFSLKFMPSISLFYKF